MAEYDLQREKMAKAVWEELQREEDSLRSKIKPKKDKKFWRKTISAKKNSENVKRWSGGNYNVNKQNKSQRNVIQSATMMKSIKHATNLLNDPESDKSKKINCLQFINQYLRNYENNKDDKTDTMEILKNVIKIFVSPMEPLRNLSIDIVSNHIGYNNKIWDYQTSIKYIIPIIVHCILSTEYQEKSEEIRLKLLYLLETIINIAANEDEIKPICGDLIAIFLKLLHDKYAEINKKVCCLLIILSKKIRLNNVSQMIIKNALHLLSCRQSKVRISCIQLIECMLLNGGHESIQILTGFREHNVVPLQWWFGGETRTNYFGALCRHKTYGVRHAFYKMIFNIMTNMVERYDYKTLLLSYVLSGLQDQNKEIQEMTFEAIENIGKMHENNEYNDLKKTLFFQKQADQISKQYFGDDNDELILPFPFKHRPCLGSRILIREHFGRIVTAALAEFDDWKDDCKEMAMLLVRNMIIYSEEYCTQNTELLLSSFHSFVSDQNDILSTTSKQCCVLIGKYIFPSIWIDYLCDMIHHEFDNEWLIVLEQLVLCCPRKRLGQIRKQVVALMEYAFPFIQTTKQIEKILNKITNVMQNYETDQDDSKEIQDDDFQFSSEFCGFHLEIIDETNPISNDKNTQTLQQRIDAIINKIATNL